MPGDGEDRPFSDPRLEEARSRMQARDADGAERICRSMLAQSPGDPEALRLLGSALAQLGRPAEALSALRAALARKPGHPDIHLNIGMTLSSMRRHAEAAAAFSDGLVADPFNPGLYLNLGNSLAEDGRVEEALTAYRKALALKPDLAVAHYNTGTLLKRLGRLDEAVDAYRTTVALEPRSADAFNNLGVVYQRLERIDEAALSYRQALALDPNHIQAQNNLGTLLRAQAQLEQAAALHEKVIQLRPDHPDAYLHLGNARTDQGRYPEAQVLYEKALSLNPASEQASNNLANVLSAQHRWHEAIPGYQRALQLNPMALDTRYNLALARLFCHDFSAGWVGYEERLRCPEVRVGLRKGTEALELYDKLPHWGGSAEKDTGDVAIWGEQGIGDQLLFSTLIPDLLETGVPFLYEVDERLLGAYQRAFPGVRFVALDKPPRPELQRVNRVCLAGSLPGLFRTSLESFARQPARLLGALPDRVAYYRDRLDALGPGPKVAFSWKSKHGRIRLGPEKSHPLAAFAPLLKQPGIRFVDVQYGDTALERADLERSQGIRLMRFDEVDYYHELEELLAILEACDLLITTSNATAHFAGALGKRTWLLYLGDRAPFYYWAHGGSRRSLWYPSVEIVTAPEMTTWPTLVDHVVSKLAGLRG